MTVLNELHSDHEALRRALAELRAALTRSNTCDAVQARLHALLGLLSGHLRREEGALIPYTNRLHAVLRQQTLRDHAEPHVVLEDLEVLFSAWRLAPTETLIIHLCRLLDELRERLDEEERDVFPVLMSAAVDTGGDDADS